MTPDSMVEKVAPDFAPVQHADGWLAPSDVYAAVHALAALHPDAKHVCWDMLVLLSKLPQTRAAKMGEEL